MVSVVAAIGLVFSGGEGGGGGGGGNLGVQGRFGGVLSGPLEKGIFVLLEGEIVNVLMTY